MTMLAAHIALVTLSMFQPEGRAEPFEGVTVDYDTRTVELTGVVALDAHSEETPDVWIELIAESGGIRDHEALVTLDAEARHVHAALLLLGLEPGSPGLILTDGTRIEPTGPMLDVSVTIDNDMTPIDPTSWVIDPDTGDRLSDLSPEFVFAGSGERTFGEQSVYMAEAEGTVVGLCTFGAGETDAAVGMETVAMTIVFSPDSGSGDTVWFADADRLPEQFTPVTLRLRSAPEEKASPPEP